MNETNIEELKAIYHYKRKGGSFWFQYLWNATLFLFLVISLSLFLGLSFVFISNGVGWACSPIIVPILFVIFMLIVVHDFRSMIYELAITEKTIFFHGFWKKSQSIEKDEIIESFWKNIHTLILRGNQQTLRLPISHIREKEKTILLHHLLAWIPYHTIEMEDRQFLEDRLKQKREMSEPPSKHASAHSSLNKTRRYWILFWFTIIVSCLIIAWSITITSTGFSLLIFFISLIFALQLWFLSRRRKISISETGIEFSFGRKITHIEWTSIEAIQWQTSNRMLVIWHTNKKFASKMPYAHLEKEELHKFLALFDEYILFYDVPVWVNHDYKG
jgi:membrane protein YdbS with pleckstrin-like domain